MVVVLCNCAPDQAESLARAVVEARLAACVNVLPGVRSVYVWEGELCEDQECTLLIKTATERVEALSARIHELHSYDTPEIVVLETSDATDAAYRSWVRRTSLG